MLNGKSIAQKIEQLIQQLGIKKTRLGEILGSAPDASKQWKYYKFNAFIEKLKNDKVIDLKSLQKIATFFDKPINHFLGEHHTLSQEVHHYETNPLESYPTPGLIDIPMIGTISEKKLNPDYLLKAPTQKVSQKNLKNYKSYVIATGLENQKLHINKKDEILLCIKCPPRSRDLIAFSYQRQIQLGYYFKNEHFIQIQDSDQEIPPITTDRFDFKYLGKVASITRIF